VAVIVGEKRRSTAALQSVASEIAGKTQLFSRSFGSATYLRVALGRTEVNIDYSLITSHHSLAKALGVHFFQTRV